MYICFKKIDDTERNFKSKGLYDEIIKPPNTFNNSLAPALSYVVDKTRVKFDGSC